MLKRLIAAFLCLTMMVTMLPAQAFAEEEEHIHTEEIQETTAPEETAAPETTEAVTESAVETEAVEETTAAETEETVSEETEVPETTAVTEETEAVEETLPEVSQEAANAYSGTYGANVSWTLSDAGVLTISGSGAMMEVNGSSSIPWDYYRSSVTKVVVQSGITTICSYAFDECINLTSVTIPVGVTKIGNWAFWGCTGLTSLTLPYTLTSTGQGAFGECSSLTSITIPSNVTTMGGDDFMDCTSLVTVNLSSNLSTIGRNMFSGCVSLKNVTIPAGVTYIAYGAFAECTALAEITIPTGVTHILDRAFAECDSLTSVTIPQSVISIGENPFEGCDKLTAIRVSSSNTAFCSDGYSVLYNKAMTKLISVPAGRSGSYTVSDSVTEIGAYAFSGCKKLTEVTIGSGVDTIIYGAFENCTALKTVRFRGDAPEDFRTSAFTGVTATVYYPEGNSSWSSDMRQNYGGTLTWVAEAGSVGGTSADGLKWTLSEGVLTISGSGNMADHGMREAPWYNYYSRITKITIGSGVKSIGSYAFYNCQSVTSVSIPTTVTSIGKYAFQSCKALTGITLPSGLTSIQEGAFAYCSALTAIAIPSGVPVISDYVFRSCTGLTSVVIPNGVKTIGNSAFIGCTGLESITISASVTTIADTAFTDCTSIASISVNANNTAYTSDSNGILYTKSMDALFRAPITLSGRFAVPASVKSIKNDAFSGCVDLTAVYMEAVTTIGSGAFENCTSLRAVYMPDTVTSISGSASTYNMSAPFAGCKYSLVVYCAAASKPSGWSSYWNYYSASSTVKACWGVSKQEGAFWTGEEIMQAEVVIPEFVTKIPDYAFNGRADLTAVTIPGSVVTIGNSAFYGTGLTELNIPEGVDTIGSNTIASCENLISLTIPASITTIGSSNFYSCPKLEGIWVDSKNPSYSSDSYGVLYNKAMTTLIRAPGALAGAYRIPDSVSVIEAASFRYCSALTSVTIPAGITNIGNYTFGSCTGLREIRFFGDAPAFSSVAFDGASATVYYLASNSTWTDSVKKQYGGTITWVGLCAGGHTPVSEGAVDATCTQPGMTAGSYCAVCTMDLSQRTVIPALGHAPETDPAVPNSCSSDGLTEGSHCDRCGEILVAQQIIPAAHKAVPIPPVAAGCNTSGLTEGSRCEVCGMVLTAQQEIPAKGHSFSDGVCTVCGAASGSCGDDLVWFLEDGIMWISGSGAMQNYSMGTAPWYSYRSKVTELVIDAGVTSVGTYAFAYCTNLKKITFEGSAPTIGANAFRNVTATAFFTADASWSDSVRQNYGGTITWVTDCGGIHVTVVDPAVAPTCTTTGLSEGSHCGVCGETIVPQNTVAALGHDCGQWTTAEAPTCTKNGQNRRDCSRCDYYETQLVSALGHTSQTVPAVAATCTATGLTEGSKCSVCGATITAQKTVAALGHSYDSWYTTTAATCTTAGTQRRDCIRCDHYQTQAIGVIPHTSQTIPAVAPTCTSTGLTEGSKCSVCGVTITAQQTVAALGHSYGSWTTTKAATCTANGTQRRDCGRCDHYETQTISATGHNQQTLPAVAATCTTSGLTEGKKCTVCGVIITAQQTVAALGHNCGSWTTTKAATCTTTGTQRRDCSRCDYFETQTTAVRGHSYSSWVTTVAATCTANGTQRRDCIRCDHYETQTIYATGHRERILSSVSATCTASGLTEGKACSTCGVTLTAQKTVPALGHSYGNWETTTGATCTTDGQERRDCVRCDHYETQAIPAPGHTEQILAALEATCTETGLTEGKQCSVCQEILLAQETVEALGHDYVNFLCQNCGEYAQGGGSVGENLTWDVDTGSGQLTITGSGSLETPEEAPWAGYEEAIREILISAGVTDIDPGVFDGCNNLTDILVDDSNRNYADQDGILFTKDGTELVKYPGGRSDSEYTVPGTVDRIGDHAFSGCESLDTLYFTDSMPAFEENAFAGADLTIYYPGGDSSWNPEKLENYGGNITWIPQYDQPEVLSITADRKILGMNGQAVLTANLNMQTEETKVLWELAPGDEAWAHLTPSGNTARLTAKTVAERTTVTVTARTKDGMAAPAQITIDILPPVSSVALLDEDGRDAAGKTIWWDLNSDRTQMTFTAQIQPTDAPGEVDWRVGDTSGTYAKYTIEDNILTLSEPAGKTGTVDIQVIAMDGSGVSAKFTVKFTSLKPETEGSEEEDPADLTLLSEKSKQLTVYDGETGKALTNKQITWSMDEVYAPYAKIDAKGKLTAKKVVEKVRVEAVGTIIGSEGTTVTMTVDIYPAVTLVELAQDGVSVNNKTLTVNYSGEPLVLTANLYPLDAMEGVTWTISDKKEAFASYTIEDNVLTIEPKEGTKAGSVTIKATSDDGSKKTATVKLQLAAYAETVTIDKSVTELTAGDKAIQLNATMEPAVVTKPGIVWSLKNADDKNYVNLSSSGKITPKNVLAPAEVVIVATSKDGMAKDEYTIKVWPKSEAQLVLRDEAGNYVTKTTQTLDVNTQKSITLSAHTYGEDKITYVTWSPLTNKAAKITENGDGSLTIQMIAAGSITVNAKAADGRKATVTVKGVKQAQSVRIAEKKTDKREGLEVASGKSLDLVATLTDAANKKVTWSITEGSAYATVSSSGKVTAAKDVTTAGNVVVRATAADGSGVYDEVEILVRPIAQGVQVYSEAGGHMLFSIRSQQWWVRSNTTLTWDLSTQGNTIAIDAHVFPYYGADNSKNAIQSVIGKSSAPKVAKLVYTDDGKVQLQVLGTGSTTVTVTAGDGSNQKVSFKLNVVRTVTDLTLEDQTVAGGKSLNLAKLVTINPSDATNKKLTWTITKGSAYATISSSGSFKAKKVTSPQKVEVTVSSQDGGASVTCIVTITP